MSRRAHRSVQAAPESGVVIDHTSDGQGVLDVTGKRVFVAGAIRGERVRYRRRKARRNFDSGELVAVEQPSPDRIVPECEVFGTCGGCSLQHIRYAAQVELKQKTLLDSLQRLGDCLPETVLEPLVDVPFHYRRRARLAVRDVPGKGRVLVGFRERHKPYVTVMRTCHTLAKPVALLIMPLAELIGSLSIRARIPQVEVALADNALELVFRVLDPPDSADRDRLRAFGEAHGLRILLQGSGPTALERIWPEGEVGPLWYGLPEFDLKLCFGPLDFVQVHAGINRRMVSCATGLLAPGADDTVLDLFCGIGNFSLPLARMAGRVIGVELSTAAVSRARDNAGANGITNAEFIAADLAVDPELPAIRASGARLAVIDPPRSGAAELVPVLAGLGVDRILYVSCHPGTLARDASALVNGHGFRLRAAGVIDMFPQTAHVEAMALFERG